MEQGERRRIFSGESRIRLADGCVLLGRTIDPDDLSRLLTDGIPFVSVGRRDDAGGPVPYVGADYPPAVRALVERAAALGHRRMAYVGAGQGAESFADRLRGFTEGVAATGVEGLHLSTVDGLFDSGATAVFAEELADGVAIVELARARGLDVPRDLSILALGASTRPVSTDIDFAGFRIPRREMGRRAVELLTGVLERGGVPQELLACELVEGSTLAPVPDTDRT